MALETLSPAVITSSAADKHLNEVVKPEVAEVNAGMQAQKAKAQTATTTPATTANPQAPSTTAGQPLNTYTYIATDGTSKTAQGKTPQEAMANARDIAAHSGVALVQPTQQPQPQEETITTKETVSTPESPTADYEKQLAKAEKEYQKRAKETESTITRIQSGAIPLSAGQQAQVEGLRAEFQQLIEQQKLTNKTASGLANVRGYQKGSAEYDPTFQVKTIGSIVTAGQNKVAELNVKMSSAIAALTQGFKDSNIAAVKDAWSVYKEASKERTDAIEKTIASTRAAIKEAQDALTKEQDKITEIAKNAAEGGADQETIANILNSGSVAEAVFSAGDSLQKGTGTVGEYLFYKKEAQRMGQVPMSFNEYATMDANRKRSIVSVNSGGLSSQEQNKFLTITNKYQSDSVINAAMKAGQITQLANQIIADPNNATNQLAALYMYVKNLDPDSAVREGELALAGKTQSYLQQFGNSIARVGKGQVLSPQAATELAKATKSLVGTWEDTAQKKTKLYQSQANNISSAVGNAFGSYIQEYNDTSYDPITREENAKQTVISYGANNPGTREQIKQLAGVVQPELGRAYTWEEIAQIIGAE